MVQIIFLSNNGKVASAPENSNLLRVSLREQGGIPFKCGGGLCGTCKCKIERGIEHTDAIKPKERNHLTLEQLQAGYRMACQTFVNGDIAVSWEPVRKPVTATRSTAPAQPSNPAE
jgi:ferredoxin